jgi:exopolyphosphatase/guanosine-5'-triphosphate,3'-diphosphate pyrophosphatase
MGDVLKTGQLASSSLEAVVNLLSKWQKDCASLNCDQFIVTGTAALRKAVNASELCSCIRAAFGWKLQIITPQQELDAVYAGVKAAFRPGLNLAVLNLGGGSTQIGVGSGALPSNRYLLDFGTRQLCDKWPWNGPLNAVVYGTLLEDVRRRVRDAIRERPENVPSHLVHTGGELDFMLRCRLPLVLSELSPHHVSEVSLEHFTRFGAEFAALAPDVACRDFSLDPAWASGAVASNVIAQSVAEVLGVTTIVPSNCNVSDGLLQAAVHETNLNAQGSQ